MENKSNYAYLIFKDKALTSGVEPFFPKKNLFENLKIEKQKCSIYGYFLPLENGAYDLGKMITMCETASWDYFSHLSAKFVLFVYFKKERELAVVTDVYGSFPVYWLKDKNRFIISLNIQFLTEMLDRVKINTHTLLQFVSRETGLGTSTLIESINKVPAACILKVKTDLTWSLESFLNKLIFLQYDAYADWDEFKERFNWTFREVVTDYVRAVGNIPLVADISAGFDSTAVAYMLKKASKNEFVCLNWDQALPYNSQNKKIIEKFSLYHDLSTNFLIHDFNNLKKSLFVAEEYPYPMNGYWALKHLQKIRSLGSFVNFGGHGGDELLSAKPISDIFPYSPYIELFKMVSKEKNGLSLIMGESGIRRLLRHDYYNSIMYYPSLLSLSALNNNLMDFQFCWDLDVWVLSPLTDLRIITTMLKAPKRLTSISKSDFWRCVYPEIHLPEQSLDSNQQNFETGFNHSFEIGRDLVVSILENSELEKLGTFKISSIKRDLIKGNIAKYIENGGSLVFLFNLLKIETYLKSQAQAKTVSFD